MRSILMEIPELALSVAIECEERNSQLCDEIWDRLPFDCVQEHGMVSGELIYCWAPLISTAPTPFTLMYTESPLGCVTYSQGTGNKIILKYGPCNEDLSAPVLGYVRPEGLESLARAGREIWFNYFGEKKIYVAHFSRLEGGAHGGQMAGAEAAD